MSVAQPVAAGRGAVLVPLALCACGSVFVTTYLSVVCDRAAPETTSGSGGVSLV